MHASARRFPAGRTRLIDPPCHGYPHAAGSSNRGSSGYSAGDRRRLLFRRPASGEVPHSGRGTKTPLFSKIALEPSRKVGQTRQHFPASPEKCPIFRTFFFGPLRIVPVLRDDPPDSLDSFRRLWSRTQSAVKP